MADASTSPVLDKLTELETALRAQDPGAETADALYQCERLRHALQHAHSEGARFAAYTLGRLIALPEHHVDDRARSTYGELKQLLTTAGHRL